MAFLHAGRLGRDGSAISSVRMAVVELGCWVALGLRRCLPCADRIAGYRWRVRLYGQFGCGFAVSAVPPVWGGQPGDAERCGGGARLPSRSLPVCPRREAL